MECTVDFAFIIIFILLLLYVKKTTSVSQVNWPAICVSQASLAARHISWQVASQVVKGRWCGGLAGFGGENRRRKPWIFPWKMPVLPWICPWIFPWNPMKIRKEMGVSGDFLHSINYSNSWLALETVEYTVYTTQVGMMSGKAWEKNPLIGETGETALVHGDLISHDNPIVGKLIDQVVWDGIGDDRNILNGLGGDDVRATKRLIFPTFQSRWNWSIICTSCTQGFYLQLLRFYGILH